MQTYFKFQNEKATCGRAEIFVLTLLFQYSLSWFQKCSPMRIAQLKWKRTKAAYRLTTAKSAIFNCLFLLRLPLLLHTGLTLLQLFNSIMSCQKPKKLRYFGQSDAVDQTANDNAIKLTQQVLRRGKKEASSCRSTQREEIYMLQSHPYPFFVKNSNLDISLRSACSVCLFLFECS